MKVNKICLTDFTKCFCQHKFTAVLQLYLHVKQAYSQFCGWVLAPGKCSFLGLKCFPETFWMLASPSLLQASVNKNIIHTIVMQMFVLQIVWYCYHLKLFSCQICDFLFLSFFEAGCHLMVGETKQRSVGFDMTISSEHTPDWPNATVLLCWCAVNI